MNVNPKYNSRKFIISIITILVILGITVYGTIAMQKADSMSEVLTTSIMWIGMIAMTYMGGNTVVNWTKSNENTTTTNKTTK